MIQVEAAIHKADITPLGELKGLANASSLMVDGKTYPRGKIVFDGFRGAFDQTVGRYVGVMRFTECAGKLTCGDLSRVDGILHPGEIDDVIHSDSN